MSIQRREPRIASAASEHEDHQADGDAVDDAPVAQVQGGWNEDRDHERDGADPDGDRLPHDVVVGIARDVEARDPRHRPQPVGDERCRRERAAPSRGAAGGSASSPAAPARDSVRCRVPASTINPSSRPRWAHPSRRRTARSRACAAGAAAVPPWPPFSITAQTTIARAVVRPVPAPPRLVLEVVGRVAGERHDLLRRPRLARDRDRIGAEDAGGGPVARVRGRVEALAHDLERRRVEACVARRVGCEPAQHDRALAASSRASRPRTRGTE